MAAGMMVATFAAVATHPCLAGDASGVGPGPGLTRSNTAPDNIKRQIERGTSNLAYTIRRPLKSRVVVCCSIVLYHSKRKLSSPSSVLAYTQSKINYDLIPQCGG
jgi:hypothetical protein